MPARGGSRGSDAESEAALDLLGFRADPITMPIVISTMNQIVVSVHGKDINTA